MQVQLRSAAMHRQAEFGVAAHAFYKGSFGTGGADDMAAIQVAVDRGRRPMLLPAPAAGD